MFDNLTDKLQRVFKNLRGQGKLSEEHLDQALAGIREALLEGDVNAKNRSARKFCCNFRPISTSSKSFATSCCSCSASTRSRFSPRGRRRCG
jgi:hypothetical protein